MVTITGKQADLKKKLEVNPKTNIPQILFTVYQHVFNSIYMLSSVLNAPYPPPDLLHPMAEKIQIYQSPPSANVQDDVAKQQIPAAGTSPPAPSSAPAEKPAQTVPSA